MLPIARVHNDLLCPACGKEQETFLYFLGKCCATMMTCCRIMGAYTLQLEELGKVTLSDLLQFVKA